MCFSCIHISFLDAVKEKKNIQAVYLISSSFNVPKHYTELQSSHKVQDLLVKAAWPPYPHQCLESCQCFKLDLVFILHYCLRQE